MPPSIRSSRGIRRSIRSDMSSIAWSAARRRGEAKQRAREGRRVSQGGIEIPLSRSWVGSSRVSSSPLAAGRAIRPARNRWRPGARPGRSRARTWWQRPPPGRASPDRPPPRAATVELGRHRRVRRAARPPVPRPGSNMVAGNRGVVEVRRAEPVPGQDDGEPRQGEADPHLVEPEPEGTVGTDPHVGRHEEERTGGEGMAGAGDGHGGREGQDALGQGRTRVGA